MMDEKEVLENWELKNVKDTAFGEGRVEGKVEGKEERTLEIAKNMLAMGLSYSQISQATGLSQDEIEKMQMQKT